MNYTYSQMISMLQGAYKKLKSYYFYDKTLLFIKRKIAEFEADDNRFEKAFDILANKLISEDISYFEKLIEQLDYQVFPKSFVATSQTKAIVGAIDHHKNIGKVNFFIDIPIELLIIDCLWTLCIAKIKNEKYGNQSCSYAGKFKPSVFYFAKRNLYDGIDWESNRCFEPYFENYSKWQSDAFMKLKEGLKTDNQLMLSLDLKSFYYSVRFEFSSLTTLLDYDSRLSEISFISYIEEKIYLLYTKLISKYKIGIDIKESSTIFPIGLLSPILLRELYLYKFDQQIRNKLSPTHYGRYVDDMIIVLPSEVQANNATSDYICNLLCQKGLIRRKTPSNDQNYVFIGFDSIAIQQEKINCFFFEKDAANILIEVAEKQIRENSSEANLLPEFDIIKNNFNDITYFFNSIGGSTKIRDIGILQSNNYAASKSVTSMKQLLKNTYISPDDRKKIEEFIRDLLEFYKGSSSVEFMGSWTSVFELILQLKVLSGDKRKRDPLAQEFFYNIKNYIDQELSFDFLDPKEIYAKKRSTVLKRLRKNLRERLRTSISMALALDYRWKTSTSNQDSNIELARKFRKSNIFNHNLVSFPLLNYLPFEQISTCSFLEIQQDPWNNFDSFTLSKERLFWTPRFIHLDELSIYYFMQSTQDIHKNFNGTRNIKKIWIRYTQINNVVRFTNESVAEQSSINSSDDNIELIHVTVPSISFSKYYVGLANTQVSEADALQSLIFPAHKMCIKDKEQLFRMANTAVKEGANFITFPEFFIPIIWLKDLTRFAQKNNITVIAGLRYIRNTIRAFNYTVIIQPCNNNGFWNVVQLFREKNFYAPEEKDCLYKLGYRVSNPQKPIYYIVHSNGMHYSTILCFEFTDIYSRACLKSKIDTLFVPQLNKDTNYFSSIVESTSRDLHCFIVQANTSKYGDSRITAPYDTIHRNIVQIKGGINDLVIIGELELDKVRTARKQYEDNRNKIRLHCFIACRTCRYHTEKQFVKDIPAHFE